MLRSSLVFSAVILTSAAGCGGSAPQPQEPEQVAIVELPKASPVAEKTPPPAPEEPKEPEEPEADEQAEEAKESEDEKDDASKVSIFGALGGNGGTLMGPIGVGSGSGQGYGGLGAVSGGMGQGIGGIGTGGGASSTPGPTVQLGATAANVTGKLPPEVIRRVVRQHLHRIRLCYTQGLAKNPALAGKVAVRFVIAGNGSVSSATDGGSTMPDKTVTACALKVFQSMTFPAPADNATVIVNYPLVFASASPPPPPPPASPPAAPPSP